MLGVMLGRGASRRIVGELMDEARHGIGIRRTSLEVLGLALDRKQLRRDLWASASDLLNGIRKFGGVRRCKCNDGSGGARLERARSSKPDGAVRIDQQLIISPDPRHCRAHGLWIHPDARK